MKTRLLIVITLLIGCAVAAHGQIVLQPEVSGTAKHIHHYWYWYRIVTVGGYSHTFHGYEYSSQQWNAASTNFINAGFRSEFRSYYNGYPYNHIWSYDRTRFFYDGVLEFDIAEFQPYLETLMTSGNWTARLNNLTVTGGFGAGAQNVIDLCDLNDSQEDGGISENDYHASRQDITTLWQTIPGSGASASGIDVTEILRRDLFGEGQGDLTTGFILRSNDNWWCSPGLARFNKDNPELEITLNTPVPTVTPTPRVTPTPTEPPTPTPFTGVSLYMNRYQFTSGDVFKLRALCSGDDDTHGADLYIILDVFGTFWFYPGWTQTPDYQFLPGQGSEMNPIFILDFHWPEGDFGSMEGLIFWGGLLNPDTHDLIGYIDFVTFGYY